jgi:integrase
MMSKVSCEESDALIHDRNPRYTTEFLATLRGAGMQSVKLPPQSPVANDEWVFPAQTRSGHIEKSSLKKQHPRACKLAKVTGFPLYTFRHTYVTRWAAYMDPYTLGYLAGHEDFSTCPYRG